jgi:hypothetical protein
MHVKCAGAVVCAVLLFAAPAAFAQPAAQQGYSQPAGSVQQQLGGAQEHPDAQHHPVSKPVVTHGSGGLPFTGLDLGLVVAAGVVLLAMGCAIRRLSGPQPA